MAFRIPVLIAALWLSSAAISRAEESQAAGLEFFEAKIRPVLVKHCYECHSEGVKEPKGRLLLDSREGLLRGGESGVAVVPGNVEGSLLIQALRYQSGEMPPAGKLPAETIAAFETWVKLGAPDPRDGKAPTAGKQVDFAEARKFWAFQPIEYRPAPAVRNAGWASNDIDRFILAGLESADLSPAAPADRGTLLRRVTFDLIGLPPTPDELLNFLNDESPDAFEKVVDRLLASAHYGERWGRHWLDVARYGEDQAHTFQARMYPQAFRYRDWVVAALNQDLPYDRFIREQIAGDLLEDSTANSAAAKERAAALGLFALGPVYYADNNAAKQAQADELDDRVDTLTRGVLGLTVACARCHDHKFDPITTRDYYALAGIFASSKYREFPLASEEEQGRKNAADEAVKARQKIIDDFLAGELKSLRPQLAREAAPYLIGVWKYINRRKSDANFALAESAKRDKLNEALLRRWRDFLTGPGKSQAALTAWRELLTKQESAADLSTDAAALAEISVVAAAFQRTLIAGAETTEADAGDKSPENAALMQAVFGEKGVLALSPNETEKLLAEERKKELKPLQEELAKQKKAADAIKLPVAHSLAEGAPIDLKILVQGNPHKTGEPAPRGFLTILSAAAPLAISAAASGRRELAEAVVGPHNPLAPRVAVNRIWQAHFGHGLVRTPSNFGVLGERPTHPELLDHLSRDFIDSGWSLKQLHRRILASAAYQQSCRSTAIGEERDPENRLLSHMHRRRLEVEPWRDAMLAASGTLDLSIGGPSTNLSQGGFRRRTLYGYVSRHQLNELLRLFDFPDPNITSDRRSVTTVPLQQLFVLNSEFLTQQAKAFAARWKNEAAGDQAGGGEIEGIKNMYLSAFGRLPTERELQIAQSFLATKPAGSLTAWEEFASALLGSNEFAFVD